MLEESAILAWKNEPVRFVREVFGAEPEPWQEDALTAFALKQRIAMKACKGPGKTCCLAWMIWNFMLTRPEAKIAATSVSADNLQDNLWAELAKWQAKSELLMREFEWKRTRIEHRQHPETWFVSARTWPRTADSQRQADTLAGLHADYILFVLDESGGIPQAVMATAEAALSTGIECKMVQAGNPIETSGPLYEACTRSRSMWHIVEITGDPENPNRSRRVSVQWAQEMIERYGRENPWVMVNVLGQFPPTAINSLLGADEVSAAMRRHLREDEYSFSAKSMGIDVARFGDDKTVLFMRQGLASFHPVEMRNARSEDIAGKVAYVWNEKKIDTALIDDTGGWAAGVIDLLNRTQYAVTPVNFSGKALDERYFNRRSEMYFLMAEWVRKGGVLPNLPELAEELTTPTYWFDKGKMRLEEKDQIKSRLGRSPDLADSLALTFAVPQPIAGVKLPQDKMIAKKHEWDYDPLQTDW